MNQTSKKKERIFAFPPIFTKGIKAKLNELESCESDISLKMRAKLADLN